MKKLVLLVVVLILGGFFYYFVYPSFVVLEVYDPRPFSENTDIASEEDSMESISQEDLSKISYLGKFMEQEHNVEGIAQVIEEDGNRVLRFQDFETVNGPDVHIYLSTGLDIDNAIDLGKIKGTKGNINYELSSDVDITKYKYVLVWSKTFGSLFSYAALEPLQMLK